MHFPLALCRWYLFKYYLAGFLLLFFAEVDKLILKFIWKCKGSRLAKITLKQNNKGGG